MAKNRSEIKLQVKHNSMDDFKVGGLPGTLLKAESEDGQSIADRELKRMVKADVFRSAGETLKASNSNNRRYK
jgi:hypothetical protein